MVKELPNWTSLQGCRGCCEEVKLIGLNSEIQIYILIILISETKYETDNEFYAIDT